MTEDDIFGDVGYARVVTCRGPQLTLVNLAVMRAPTVPTPTPSHVLEELRAAALADRVRASLAGRRR